MKRRAVLLSAAAGAGALLVGWSFLPARSRLGLGALMRQGEGEFALNGWIKIAADGAVVLAMPRSEMGQGVHTALPMLAAEELDVPLSAVRIEPAGSDAIYGNVAMLLGSLPFHPQEAEQEDGFGRIQASRWMVGKLARELGINATGGSSSVADAWDVVRTAAATARASLLGAASLHWRLPVEELTVHEGVISHSSGKSAPYGALARFAAATPPGAVRLKAREEWTLIGRPARRLDVPANVDGSAVFGIDVRVPGMKYAVPRFCPMLGGSAGRIDASAALRMPGVERLVMLPAYAGSTAGFAIVGRSYWHAKRAVDAVEVDWQPAAGAAPDTRQIATALRAAVEQGPAHTFHVKGSAEAAQGAFGRVVESWYSAPYLAHATLEPMNCTARWAAGRLEVWAPTQVPGLARAAAARLAGVAPEQVELHTTLLGGGFGRRLEVDFVMQAVRVALDCPGAAVQLVWPREEDLRHDFYRPMQVARLRATVDAQGLAQRLEIRSAGDAISPRWIERTLPSLSSRVDAPDKTTSEGLFDIPYAFDGLKVEHVATRMGVPVGFWRSVGHSHNAFISEGFIDELAEAARLDGFEFRRRLLRGSRRHLAVLELAAQKAGWGSALPPGRARGIALHESFGSVVAQVAEVSIEGGQARVHKVACAIDCGTVVNPAIVAQQMESSVVYALTAALHGRIDIRAGTVQQGNFPAYEMVRLKSAPAVQTSIVPSQRGPSGVGEPGVPPLAPAVASALFALTGVRQRELPFRIG